MTARAAWAAPTLARAAAREGWLGRRQGARL